MRSGSVDIFNIVGRIAEPKNISSFTYKLNGGSFVPICFNGSKRSERLSSPGAFNIDTISLADLEDENNICFRIHYCDGREILDEITFFNRPFTKPDPNFLLRFGNKTTAEELGQIVDGHWKIRSDDNARPYLEISEEDAGYDRIILFGRKDWGTCYEVYARLAVTKILRPHNVGIVFQWNPHEAGDGTWLPTKWSTGLAYYSSYGSHAGIRLRYGVNVHIDKNGRKKGDYDIKSRPLSIWRRRTSILQKKLGLTPNVTELRLNKEYCFRLKIHPKRYSLAIWRTEQEEPKPQLVINKPRERLHRGAVGIIAHQVAIRLYEVQVRPLKDVSRMAETFQNRQPVNEP